MREWIKLDDCMPRLNQEIELKFKNGEQSKAVLKIIYEEEGDSQISFYLSQLNDDEHLHANPHRIDGWRPLDE